MASIKVNYNVGENRTSTTFSELTARFFIQAWHSMQRLKIADANDWIIMQKNDIFYRDIDEVRREFQDCVYHLIRYYDNHYRSVGAKGIEGKPWTRGELEYHILLNIAQSGHGTRLKGD